MQQLIVSKADILDNQAEFLSTETPRLLHDLALAAGILAAISAIVQMSLHFFVPGF